MQCNAVRHVEIVPDLAGARVGWGWIGTGKRIFGQRYLFCDPTAAALSYYLMPLVYVSTAT
jgi:hypothetical protein